MEKMKNLCIIQARMGSVRLPGKVLMKVGSVSLLEYQIKRVQSAKKVDKIVVATTVNKNDDRIEKTCKKLRIACFRGSDEDVLDRYWKCAQKYPRFKNIVRITADCPLIDPVLIDQTISFFEKENYDFASNAFPGKEKFPDGMDVEVFTREVLEEAAKKAILPADREHVDEYMFRNKKIHKGSVFNPQDWSHFRLTVDNPEDFEVVKFIIENSKQDNGYLDYISLLSQNLEVMKKNLKYKRNEKI